MKNYIKFFYIAIIVIGLFFLYYFIPKEEAQVVSEQLEINKVEEKSVETNANDKYYIDIKGEVKKPGVYQIEKDSRIIDAINIAGGLTKNADTSILNLSKKVTDEMNIKIYSKKEINAAKELIEPKTIEVIKEVEKIIEKECNCPENPICDNTNVYIETNEKSEKENNEITEKENNDIIDEVQNNKVNINTASKQELMSVSGIGSAKADSIIEYRKSNKFNSIDDIKNISGIGDSLFEKIKEYITV